MLLAHDQIIGGTFRGRPRGAAGWVCLGVAGSLLLVVLPAGPAEAAAPALSDNVVAQIHALQQEKARRTPAQRKMDSHLVYAAQRKRQEPLPQVLGTLPVNLPFEADGRVLVDIDAEVTDAVLGAIKLAGGEIVATVPRFQSVRARLPLEQVEALAARNDIRFIRPAVQATTNAGSVDSEGNAAHGAITGRSTYAADGTGIKVGVLSDSATNLAASIATGNLGAVTILSGQGGAGNDEGRAMLEIVHDLAPGAQLYFASAFNGEAQFAQNILDLRAAGCDIIVDDVMYFDEPPFQDGVVAQAVNAVTASGALYFSSSGNSGNKTHSRSGTWEGDFVDGGPAGALEGGVGRLHNFGGATYNTLTTLGAIPRVDLFWSDPWGASGNDYDLYVLDSTGSTLKSVSDSHQGGAQNPYESCFTNIAVNDRIVVVLYSGTNRFLHLETGWGRLSFNTTGATRGHNAASNAIGVAAVSATVNAYPNPFTGGAGNPVESFSADGPRRVFYNPDGSAITPGNFSATGGALLQKPDLAAADGVSTSLALFDPFYGTSAAAPHAAALAALAWSFDLTQSAAAVRSAMLASTLDIEAAGTDRDSGAGIVMAMPLLQRVASNSAPLFVSARLAEATGNGNGVPDPGETIHEWIAWTNRSVLTRTHVIATLSSATPGVTILQGSVSYPDLPSHGSASNATPFSYRLAKGIPAGTVAVFTNRLSCDGAVGLATFTRVIGPTLYATNTIAGAFASNAIPDLDYGSLYSNLTVAVGGVTLDDVNVAVRIDHAVDRDLEIAAQHPDGTEILLSVRNGGAIGSKNFGTGYAPGAVTSTVFDDQAGQAIGAGVAPFAGAYQPFGSPTNLLSNLNGKPASGTWRLRITDLTLGDTGTLYQWGLTLATHTNGGIYNNPPVASNQSASVAAGSPVALVLRGSDVDADPLTFRITRQPAHGALQGMDTNSGAVTYLASAAYQGADSFTFVVNDGVVDSPAAFVSITVFPAITNTLTVTSDRGGAWPGTLSTNYATVVGQWITNSPVTAGATQYVCTGASATGNAFAQVSPTNVTLTLTNTASLTWLWQTQYLAAVTTNGSGTITGGGWYAAGSNAALSAIPSANWHFTGWSGDTGGCVVAGSTITAGMTQARSMAATFAPDPKTLTVVSLVGATWPGSVTTNYGAFVSEYITNAVMSLGGTQFVCTAASVASNAFTQVNATNVTLTLTNNATLTWYWQWGPLMITTPGTLPSGTAGYPCTRVLAATGGTQPYSWSLVSGALPAGLSLASTGVISGTASAKTNATVTIRVTGFDGLNTNKAFTLAINPAVSDAGCFWTNYVGQPGSSGSSNGTGTVARFNYPKGVAVDSNGNLYVTDWNNHTLCQATPGGVVSTLAGTPLSTGSTDGTGSVARFNRPAGVAVDAAGNVYVVDSENHTIRRAAPSGTNWVVTTIAGSAGFFNSTDGTNSAARFHFPAGIAVDSNGTLFVVDRYNHTIRRVTPSGTNWVVSTIAGTADSFASTDGTNGAARFKFPVDVTVDAGGNLFVVDQINNTIRKVASSGTNWVVTTIAGTADTTGSADGTGRAARFDFPGGIATDGSGNLFVSDSNNCTVRQLTPSSTNWIVTTVGGLAPNAGSTPGTGSVARFAYPAGIVADSTGALFLADMGNNRISRGVPLAVPTVATASPLPAGAVGASYSQALAAGGGQAPYAWTITSGSLPSGLQLSGGGVVSGTPDTAGTADFLVQVTGSDGLFSTRSLLLSIAAPATLTVVNARGAAAPDNGVFAYATGSVVAATVPAVVGSVGTQYLCQGGAVVGNDYSLVNPTNITLTLTNSATLTWNWQTNYWLHVSAGANGSAAPTDVWEASGSNVLVTATPATYYAAAGWSGATNGGVIDGSQITIPMDAARSPQALFAALLATNGVPHWWLAQYGLTNGGFDGNALLDADLDGMPNWAEYVAGTDPTNAASLLHIAGFTPGSGVAFTPAFTTRIYAVLSATNVASTNWVPLATYQPGTGAVTALPATNALPTIFYRIGVQVP